MITWLIMLTHAGFLLAKFENHQRLEMDGHKHFIFMVKCKIQFF